jgi:serine/threonine protein kinase
MSIPILDILREGGGDSDLALVVTELVEAYGFGQDENRARRHLLEHLLATIDDETPARALSERVARIYQFDGTREKMRGPLGVYLLLTEDWASTPTAIDMIRRDAEVIDALFDALDMRRQKANLLPNLPTDGAAAISQLRAYYGFNGTTANARVLLLHHADLLLREEFLDPAVVGSITNAYKEAAADPAIRGPLGLFLALNDITAQALSSRPRPTDDARAYMTGDPAVLEALFDLYELDRDEVSIKDVELYRIGTTSFILRASWRPSINEQVAVKCLLPRYFRNRRIRERTRNYEKARIRNPHVPVVRRSTDRAIIMAFVEGPTLAEKIADRAVPRSRYTSIEDHSSKDVAEARSLTPRDVDDIRARFTAICDVLAELYREDHNHLDLSPANVIVTDETRVANGEGRPTRSNVSLIDFGRNFIVTERVGSHMALPRAAVYVAPELQQDPDAGDWRSDAYSLGVILLEMASNTSLEIVDLSMELDRLWIGDEDGVWSGAPTLARVVEELIDEDPENRLLLAPGRDEPDWNPFTYIGDLIRQEAAVQEHYEERTEGHGFGRLQGFGLLRIKGNIQIDNLLQARSSVKKEVDDTYRVYPELGRWAAGSLLCWSLILGLGIAFTGADLHVPLASALGQWFVNTLHPHFAIGDFWGNVAGRAVAVIFSAINVTYYVNIFSTLALRQIDPDTSRRPRSSELWLGEACMRATAMLISVPVLWAIVWNPQAWPLCCGFGTLPVVANNFLTLRVAQSANDEARHHFSTHSVAWERFVKESYSEWWKIMGLYSLAFIVIGFLLNLGIAQDAGIFAVLVCITNVFKIYRLNCVRLAPQVRGWMSRSVLTLRRLRSGDVRPELPA